MTQAKDEETFRRMQINIERTFEETLFKVDAQMRSLDSYKEKYDSLVRRVEEQAAQIDEYMTDMHTKVANYFSMTDKTMLQVS